MGQAKRRGSFEERVKQSEEKYKIELQKKSKLEQERLDALSPEEQRYRERCQRDFDWIFGKLIYNLIR